MTTTKNNPLKNINPARLIVISIALVLLSACGGGGSSFSESGSGGSSSSSFSDSSLSGGAVSALTFDSSNKVTIDSSDLESGSNYVLALYSYNEGGSTYAYQLGDESVLEESDSSLRALVTSEPQDVTEDFHQMLREQENDLDESASLDPAPQSNHAVIKAASTPSVGSTKNFKVLSTLGSSSGYVTVTATLRYASAHFLAYVDSRNASSLSDSDLSNLLANYEAVIGDEEALFGTSSDVDGDGHFNILFTQAVNQLGGSSGGIITGFFYAVDLFAASQYSQSNESEVIYTFVPDPSGSYGATISKEFALSNILPTVLPHEYQHMINFNMHYFINGGSAENSFLNEGLSHLAEDIYSQNSSGYMTETSVENPARISGYLNAIDDYCITCGASLYQRGGIYLMLRYLYEQAEKGNLPAAADGATMIGNLLDTTKTGVRNIVNATYGESDYVTRFRQILGQYALAVFMDNTGLSSDDRLSIDGINLRSVQDDNRGTTLQGPTVNTLGSTTLANTVAGASVSYVEMSAEQLSNRGGTFTLQLGTGAQMGAYLIQTSN